MVDFSRHFREKGCSLAGGSALEEEKGEKRLEKRESGTLCQRDWGWTSVIEYIEGRKLEPPTGTRRRKQLKKGKRAQVNERRRGHGERGKDQG